jgi:hypothetical protein
MTETGFKEKTNAKSIKKGGWVFKIIITEDLIKNNKYHQNTFFVMVEGEYLSSYNAIYNIPY